MTTKVTVMGNFTFSGISGEKKKKRVNIVHFYVAHLGAIRMQRSNGERLYVVQEFVKILLQTELFAWVRDAILCTASKPV